MTKSLGPIVIIVIVILVTWFIRNRLILTLDFSQAFKSSPQPLPKSDSALRLPPLEIQGIDGDKMILQLEPPQPPTPSNTRIRYSDTNSSEKLTVTEKNLEEIKASLNQLELEKWESLTNLPSSIFRFSVSLSNSPSSPNNAKKISHFLITGPNGTSQKLLPGQTMIVAQNLDISSLPINLSKTQIKLIYENGINQSFYDEKGEMISQATGKITIKPSLSTLFWIFFGIWAFVIALITLTKETIKSNETFYDLFGYLKNKKQSP